MDGDNLSIGALARATGTKVETVRYYERAGLLPAPARTAGNYRAYRRAHLDRLGFIRRARELGFSLDEVRELLRLSDRPDQPCEEVDRIARGHLAEVERKIAGLAALGDELRSLIGRCRRGTVAECRIIEALAPGPAQAEKDRPVRQQAVSGRRDT
jgi:DNA-binding transcriptional MerR regulator